MKLKFEDIGDFFKLYSSLNFSYFIGSAVMTSVYGMSVESKQIFQNLKKKCLK